MDEAILDEHGIRVAQHVLPGAERRGAYALVQHARLAVEVAVEAVRGLHHVGCPHHFGCRPVHQVVGPGAEVLRCPDLGRAVAVARAVGGGVEVVGVTELLDGGVGEVAGDERVAGAGGIPAGRLLGGLRRSMQDSRGRQQEEKGEEFFHIARGACHFVTLLSCYFVTLSLCYLVKK